MRPAVELRDAVSDAARAARRSGRRQWLALRSELSDAAGADLLCATRPGEEGFYWEHPAQGRALAARGCAAALEARGPGRFQETARGARALFADLHVVGEAAPEAAGPLLVGGFAFRDSEPSAPHWADFPAARLVLPEWLLARVDGRLWATALARVDADSAPDAVCDALHQRLAAARRALSSPLPGRAPLASAAALRAAPQRPPADYCARVEAALRSIAAGELEKVVVAREVRLHRDGGFDPLALLQALRGAHPSCTTFALLRRDSVFLGASPEPLVRLSGRRVETSAVAGSAPRGRTPQEDGRLARELLESKKEQAEHAAVVRALRESLADCCEAVETAESPTLMQLEGIQHLDTPLAGRLARPLSVIELAERVHPTPSVAGSPRREALDWLAREEGLERGLYAGPVGCVAPSGGGELCVALRSALLRGDAAHLFAGAGIVAGSLPEAELRETRLKLGALLAPLLEL